jgi:16S rRNA (guanine1207-N2)-methyltransferase
VTQYFEEDPTVESAPRDVVWALPDGPLILATDHGVFGYDRVDTGTKLLLIKAPAPPQHGHLADLGCGTGAIAIAMARRAPQATVWAIDVNSRARELCTANALRNGVTNVRVVHPDSVPADVLLAALWSNPPIRIGKPALHTLLENWLARLDVDGVAHLVVQKHLGADSLQRWLNDRGLLTSRVATGAGFRVLHVRGARRIAEESPSSGVDLDA